MPTKSLQELIGDDTELGINVEKTKQVIDAASEESKNITDRQEAKGKEYQKKSDMFSQLANELNMEFDKQTQAFKDKQAVQRKIREEQEKLSKSDLMRHQAATGKEADENLDYMARRRNSLRDEIEETRTEIENSGWIGGLMARFKLQGLLREYDEAETRFSRALSVQTQADSSYVSAIKANTVQAGEMNAEELQKATQQYELADRMVTQYKNKLNLTKDELTQLSNSIGVDTKLLSGINSRMAMLREQNNLTASVLNHELMKLQVEQSQLRLKEMKEGIKDKEKADEVMQRHYDGFWTTRNKDDLVGTDPDASQQLIKEMGLDTAFAMYTNNIHGSDDDSFIRAVTAFRQPNIEPTASQTVVYQLGKNLVTRHNAAIETRIAEIEEDVTIESAEKRKQMIAQERAKLLDTNKVEDLSTINRMVRAKSAALNKDITPLIEAGGMNVMDFEDAVATDEDMAREYTKDMMPEEVAVLREGAVNDIDFSINSSAPKDKVQSIIDQLSKVALDKIEEMDSEEEQQKYLKNLAGGVAKYYRNVRRLQANNIGFPHIQGFTIAGIKKRLGLSSDQDDTETLDLENEGQLLQHISRSVRMLKAQQKGLHLLVGQGQPARNVSFGDGE